jgi:ferredoxin
MAKRQIIEIDRNKCDGCGLCTEACAEGALVLDEKNKAFLAKEIYCDGMGACLDVCPTGALRIVEKESEVYDAKATFQHVMKTRGKEAAAYVHGIHSDAEPGEWKGKGSADESVPNLACGCPGSLAREIQKSSPPQDGRAISGASELSQWPIQLHLVSPHAPYFDHSDLLIAADCTAFALGSFHQDLLKGKKLIVACPKLDDTTGYIEKIAEILRSNTIYSLTVATMVVPCCSGLMRIVERAAEISGTHINIRKIVINMDGGIVSQKGDPAHSLHSERVVS